METISIRSMIKNFDWRWVIVSYCFFVLFHLLPSFLVGSTVLSSLIFKSWGSVLWCGIGVFITSYYIGHRSIQYTLFEPSLASIVYSMTLSLVAGRLLFSDPLENLLKNEIPFILIVFCCSLFGAALGEWIHWRVEKKTDKHPKEIPLQQASE